MKADVCVYVCVYIIHIYIKHTEKCSLYQMSVSLIDLWDLLHAAVTVFSLQHLRLLQKYTV